MLRLGGTSLRDLHYRKYGNRPQLRLRVGCDCKGETNSNNELTGTLQKSSFCCFGHAIFHSRYGSIAISSVVEVSDLFSSKVMGELKHKASTPEPQPLSSLKVEGIGQEMNILHRRSSC